MHCLQATYYTSPESWGHFLSFCDDNDNDKDTHKDQYKDKDEDKIVLHMQPLFDQPSYQGCAQWNHDRLTDSVTKWLQEKLAHLKRSDHCWSSFYCQPGQLGCTQLYWWSVRYGRRVVGWSENEGKKEEATQPQIWLSSPHCPHHQLWTCEG